jgi:hypothetical protein
MVLSEWNDEMDVSTENDEMQTAAPSRLKIWAAAVIVLVSVPGGIAWNSHTVKRDAVYREAGYNHLYQFMLLLKMYANESPQGAYPPMAPYDDVWMFDVEAVYPEYISDLSLLVARDAPKRRARLKELKRMEETGKFDWERVARIAAESYVYLGWAVTSLDQIPDLAKQRGRLTTDQYDSEITDEDGNVSYFRLRQGVERFMAPNVNDPRSQVQWASKIIIMFESPRIAKRRRIEGSNFLYMMQNIPFIKDGEPGYDVKEMERALHRTPGR